MSDEERVWEEGEVGGGIVKGYSVGGGGGERKGKERMVGMEKVTNISTICRLHLSFSNRAWKCKQIETIIGALCT